MNLDEEKFGFAGEAGALVGREVGPQVLRLEGVVRGVQDSQFTVG